MIIHSSNSMEDYSISSFSSSPSSSLNIDLNDDYKYQPIKFKSNNDNIRFDSTMAASNAINNNDLDNDLAQKYSNVDQLNLLCNKLMTIVTSSTASTSSFSVSSNDKIPIPNQKNESFSVDKHLELCQNLFSSSPSTTTSTSTFIPSSEPYFSMPNLTTVINNITANLLIESQLFLPTSMKTSPSFAQIIDVSTISGNNYNNNNTINPLIPSDNDLSDNGHNNDDSYLNPSKLIVVFNQKLKKKIVSI